MEEKSQKYCKKCNKMLLKITGAKPGLCIKMRCNECKIDYCFNFKNKCISVSKSLEK
jgi:hypothetical protein